MVSKDRGPWVHVVFIPGESGYTWKGIVTSKEMASEAWRVSIVANAAINRGRPGTSGLSYVYASPVGGPLVLEASIPFKDLRMCVTFLCALWYRAPFPVLSLLPPFPLCTFPGLRERPSDKMRSRNKLACRDNRQTRICLSYPL